MTKSPELLPCPFCGKDANYDCANNGTEHGVTCSNEFCIGYYMTGAEGQGYYTKHYAVEAWNIRADLAQRELAEAYAAVRELAILVDKKTWQEFLILKYAVLEKHAAVIRKAGEYGNGG